MVPHLYIVNMSCYLKLNYSSNEIIDIQADNVSSTQYRGDMQVLLIRIYDYYDESFWVSAQGSVENGLLTCNITSPLERGLYALSCIREKETGAFIYGNEDADNTDRWYASGVFSVDMGGTEERYRSVVEYIQKYREDMLSVIKVEDQPVGTDIFDVFVFIKNIKVKTVLQYGDIELIPYREFVCLSEVSLIDSYMQELGIQLNFDRYMNSNVRPTAIARVSNIQSGDGLKAEKYAIRKTEYLCYLYSFLTHGNGEIFAVVSLNKSNQTSRMEIINPHYTGDLLLLGDQGFYIRHLYENLNADNPKALMYLKLFSEAMRDMERLSRYYRLWMTLVTIAEGKSYNTKVKYNWDGSISEQKDKDPFSYDKLAVFELLRDTFSSEDKEQRRFRVASITNVEDFILVCYQRRCCYAHHGECNINNDTICKTKDIHKLCKSHTKKDLNYSSVFDDPVLMCLESIVNEIISRELLLCMGKSKKEQVLIEEYLDGRI